MKRFATLSVWLLASAFLLPACSRGGSADAEPDRLPTPFTAEQIRDAMPPGLELELRRAADGSELVERWRVVAADAEGVDIEFTALDASGNAAGPPRVSRSGWTELRDHASFPAAHATREETVRDTPLGKLDGWLYTVKDPEGGTVTRYFFARSLPGAPVEMTVTRGETVVVEMAQLSRNRP
jgi:hypothetical protein